MTRQDLLELVKQNSTGRIPVHNCSMCGYPCGYQVFSVEPEIVAYDCGCDCTYGGPNYEQSSLVDIYQWYEMQSEEKHKQSVANKIAGKSVNDKDA